MWLTPVHFVWIGAVAVVGLLTTTIVTIVSTRVSKESTWT
jgi:hypothetical protein